ncbi:ATP/GTP-binding protein (plasmid) [Cellulosimicrobium sp. PMB13]|uniref:ATP/GTP-binding protein n=1 Tax=Cellulosimicrobium sp. PMB13 TaxID=3120158 RepID=UPI003F4B8F69
MDTKTVEQVQDTQAEAAGGVAARRPWWAKIPGLGIFVPPVIEPAADAGEDGGVGEVLPLNAPGATLRLSPRAARAGWYAPTLSGAPSTTRQAEILNLALIAPPTGTEGVVNGRDVLSRALIAHDAPTAYNQTPRDVTSPNVLVFGGVGWGKSSFTKTVCVARPLVLQNRSAVVFDKKANDDNPEEGEYAPLARRLGSEPIRFTQDGTGTRLNIMDPLIAAGTGTSGQYDLLTAIARVARDDAPLNEWEKKALRAALRRTFAAAEAGRAPVAADLLPQLGAVADDPEFSDLNPRALDRLHEAGLSVRWTFDELLNAYPGLLDGETSREVDLTHKLTVFDLSQLPDAGPAVPVVMAIGNMWLMGRLRRARGADRSVTNVVYEEGWHMIGGPSAGLIKSNEKLSRALGISNVFVMHKGTDIPKDSPGYSVVQEAQTVYAFRQDRRDDAEWAASTFNLAPETVDTLMGVPVGHCVMKIGSRPEIQLQHVRSRWETEVTNTDAALAVVKARG